MDRVDSQEPYDMNKKNEKPSRNAKTYNGFCHECAKPEGFGGGFSPYYSSVNAPNDRFEFWYCNWCMSNNVTIRDAGGSVVWEHH